VNCLLAHPLKVSYHIYSVIYIPITSIETLIDDFNPMATVFLIYDQLKDRVYIITDYGALSFHGIE
jgi:hypothetical protein